MNLSDSIPRWLLLLSTCATALITAVATPATLLTATNAAKPGCPVSCGNVTIPYPFGVGLYSGCSLSGPTYDILCSSSTPSGPTKPYLYSPKGFIEVLGISESRILIRNVVAFKCFSSSGQVTSREFNDEFVQMNLDPSSPFTFSASSNRLTVVGCADDASIFGTPIIAANSASCNTQCSSLDDVVSGQCNRRGCCQAAVPKGMRGFSISTGFQTNNSLIAGFNPCGYAFLGAQDDFVFQGASDLNDPVGFINRTIANVPIVLNWVIGNQTCSQAQMNLSSYPCQQKTTCSDDVESGIGGYRCSCLTGYQGNPYLPPGCTDINECDDPSLNKCSNICHNTEGSYLCTCPRGYSGDAKKDGTGCMKKSTQVFVLKLGLGLSFVGLFLVVALCWVYLVARRRKLIKMKEKFFQQNGGLLMKELLSASNLNGMEASKIFTDEELKVATDNYSQDRKLGEGGYGTVYKGVLKDKQVVAIKKSKVVDQNQIEQFINEMVILTQINHRNVVKLLGCCLETEVPLLVYEYISNGTLLDHIEKSRRRGEQSWLTWSNCLRIASEAADALAYLHSAATTPIIHRDVKSANILLDHTYTAKISDFGASRLIPLDQSQLATLVQGTLGYLDPEYYGSGLLTEKSDVYSFGVVIAELLTKEKFFDPEKPLGEQNLTMRFLHSLEEERMFEFMDPRIVSEASREQLVAVGRLVQRCFSYEGKDRPTMREVAMELERIKQLKRHPWEEQGCEQYEVIDTNGLDNEEGDLYPIPSFDTR